MTDVSVIFRNDAQTGIQRVVRAIWTNLLEQSGVRFDVVPVYASRTHGYRYARSDFLSTGLTDRLQGKPVEIVAGDRFLGLDLSAHVLPSHRRQLKSWRAAGATVHIVVYDLLPLQRPEWFTDKAARRFKRWFEVIRTSCDQALCISDHVANEVRERIAGPENRPAIGRLRLAGDLDGSRPSRGIDRETAAAINYAQNNPALLMVGTIEPRKGYDVALAAFEQLWAEQGNSAPALIVVGKPGWRTEKLQEKLSAHPEKGGRLHWLQNVSDEGLAKLFEASCGVFHASYAEGFGLPAIEAAMHNKHVLVRDLPVFREQRLGNLKYFRDDDPAYLATRLIELAEAGPAPAAILPTWSDCVRNLIVEMGIEPAKDRHAAQEWLRVS